MVNVSYEHSNITITWQSDSPVELQVKYIILECAKETGGSISDYISLRVTTITVGRNNFTMQVKNNSNYTFSIIAVKSENEKSTPTIVNYTTPESGRPHNTNPADAILRF